MASFNSHEVIIPLARRENYYCNHFDGEQAAGYAAAVDSLSRGVLSVEVKISGTPEHRDASVRRIAEAVDFGCPELFFVDKQTSTVFNPSTGMTTVRFSSKYGTSRLADMWADLDAQLEENARQAEDWATDYDKIGTVNEILCNRILGSSSATAYGDAYGALVKGEARCEGIAKAVLLILERLGIQCLMAYGKAGEQGQMYNHAWNIVFAHGEAYNFDFSWNISRTAYGIPCVAYLFLPDDEIKVDHVPAVRYPVCKDSKMTHWARNHGEITYSSDFSSLKIIPYKNNYYALAKILLPLSQEEIEERIADWFYGEMSGESYCSAFAYQYFQNSSLLMFYLMNDETN